MAGLTVNPKRLLELFTAELEADPGWRRFWRWSGRIGRCSPGMRRKWCRGCEGSSALSGGAEGRALLGSFEPDPNSGMELAEP